MEDAAPAILIVDDEATNRTLYRTVLKDLGAELYTAASGGEALDLCSAREYAMILIDVHLHDMSGFDLARQLREREPPVDTPIAFMSAVYTHETDEFHGYELGAVDYLLSPVVPAILRAKASVFIRLYRMHRQAIAQRSEIEAAYRELRSAHSELEQFSYSASHDLRNALFQVAGFTELLAERMQRTTDMTANQLLSQAVAATRRMNGLIDDLLTLSKVASGELEPWPVDLSALARQVVKELAAAQPGHRVQCQIAEGLRVIGNEGLLHIVMSNLLGNAWKYTAQSAAPSVEVGSFETEQGNVYFVADNGPGFDARAAGDRLFRPFQRFHSSETFQGSGIGLAIVHRIVVKHGGRIWAESSPGHGARFFFTLPLALQPPLADAS